MLHGVLHGLLGDLVQGARRVFGSSFREGSTLTRSAAGEALADARRQAVQRGAQAGALHRGGVQLVAVFAHLLHHVFEQLLDFGDAAAGLRRDALQVHADQIELQPERGEVLPHRVVQELGDHVALEFLGLERAQHGVAQFLLGRAPGGDFAGDAAGVADLALACGWETR